MTERAEDLQLATLRAFIFLCSVREDWGGALILASRLGGNGEALSIASNIAGAGFLGLDSRPEICRATLRSGASDFVVNSVDEALRVLKNEIRKRSPVSVALSLDECAGLEELVERGVQPALFATFGDVGGIVEGPALQFRSPGAVIANFDRQAGIGVDAEARLADFMSKRGLGLVALPCLNGEQLREQDAQLLRIFPPGDARRRWLAAASRFFHRDRPHRRWIYLSAAEREKVGADFV